MRKLKRIAVCLLAAVLCLCLAGFDEKQQKVYDDADLLEQEQKQQLEKLAVEYAREIQCDLIIVTIDDNQGKSPMTYAEDFYMAHAFGYDTLHGDGVLLLIDMEDREIWISTSGRAIDILSDIKISYILDECAPLLTKGRYYKACRKFLDETRRFIENPSLTVSKDYRPADEGSQNTPGGFLLTRIPLCLAIAAGTVWFLRRKAKSAMTVNGHTYAKEHQCQVELRQDQYIRTTVTKTPVPKTSSQSRGGGTFRHRGSGGHSFGGGGRKF